MSRLVSRAESWERVYEAFENVNFAAFDFNTIKQSLLDYVKLHFPESFNDFIETSEFIALIESFAYIAEQIAYRLDVNAHENFISTAQRRDSILRLAKLISYTASRPLPARGLVKMSSVTTTESVIDANGNDLANVAVRWNDSANANWKDQFILVMNRVLAQEFGSVGPNDRFQIQDVLFEIYDVNLVPLTNGVFRYTASVNGVAQSMELVPVAHDTSAGIVERRPANNSNFTLLYASDGLGDASETTGFLMFTKQGSLQRFRTTFDGVTPNQFYDIPATNVNDIDVWLNNVDSTTGETLDLPSPISFRPSWSGKSGEWVQVDLAHSQNIIFNTNPNRNKYEVETRDENAARLIFGDGEYADIPAGTFDVWARTSVDEDIVVPQSSAVDRSSSFTYVDALGNTQTFTFTFTLIGSLQNASAAETLDHIRATAPSVYYTQDRMVNSEDYNVFMLQDPSILKLRALNRTFAGDSHYIPWHDGSDSYENVKLFGDDGILYFQEKPVEETTPVISLDALIANYIEPLLATPDLITQLSSAGVPPSRIRTFFTTDEKDRITAALTPPPAPAVAHLYFKMDAINDIYEWYTIKGPPVLPTDPGTGPLYIDGLAGVGYPSLFIPDALITVTQTDPLETSYVVQRQAERLVFESQATQFWNTNDADSVLDYDTFTSNGDIITILKANVDYSRDGVLSQNWVYDVLGQENVESGPEIGLPDIHRLSVLPSDVNEDGYPDNLDPNATSLESVADIFNFKTTVQLTAYQNVVVAPATLGADVTALPADTYDFDVTIDGGALQALSITTVGGETYTALAALMDAVVVGGSVDYDNTLSAFVFTSNSAIPTSAVLAAPGTFGSSGGDLFAALTLADTVTFTFETPVNGSVGLPYTLELPIYYIVSGGIVITPDVSVSGGFATTWTEDGLPNEISSSITFTAGRGRPSVIVNDYVYFSRATTSDPWIPAETSFESIDSFIDDTIAVTDLWKRHSGRDALNFAWFHFSPRYYLVDPAPTNIIDMSIITKGYFTELKNWLEDPLAPVPNVPTPLDLRTSYGYLLENKMISDQVVLQPGRIKLLFGAKAPAELQAIFRIVRSANGILTDNQVKTTVVSTIRNYFDITLWEFGETFFFTELAAAIHTALPTEISSVVLVPTYATNQFGDMFQVLAREDEVFYPDIAVNQIEIVTGYTASNLRLNG